MIEKINSFKLPLSFRQLKWIFMMGVTIAFCVGFFESIREGEVAWHIARNKAGELVWWLLIFTVYVSMLHRLLPNVFLFRQLLPLRKHSGVMAFLIGVAHALFQFIRADVLTSLSGMWAQSFQKSIPVTLGTIGLLIMVPLFITSTNYAVQKMGEITWKRLHRLTHVVFILAGLHIALIQYSKHLEYGSLIIMAIYLMGYAYLLAKRVFGNSQTT